MLVWERGRERRENGMAAGVFRERKVRQTGHQWMFPTQKSTEVAVRLGSVWEALVSK